MELLLTHVAIAEEISSARFFGDCHRRVADLSPRSAAELHTKPSSAGPNGGITSHSRRTDRHRRRGVVLPGAGYGGVVVVEGHGDAEADAAAVAIPPPPAHWLGLMHHLDRSGDKRRVRIGEEEEEEEEGRNLAFCNLRSALKTSPSYLLNCCLLALSFSHPIICFTHFFYVHGNQSGCIIARP